MSVLIDRAGQLMQLKRYGEAEQTLHKALAEDPNSAQAFLLLALCRLQSQRYEEALEAANEAVRLQPGNDYAHHYRANAFAALERIDEGHVAIDHAIEIDPTDPNHHWMKGQLFWIADQWKEGLACVEKALSFDPEHVDALNLRSQLLVKLNRKEEATIGIQRALEKEPDNAWSHANMGWTKLEQNKVSEGKTHFLEALRLDPANEFARQGLREAIKAKFLPYRLLLNYFLWIAKHERGTRIAIIVGIYVGYRLISTAARMAGLMWLVLPIGFIYLTFVFGSWIGIPLSNFVLLFHPLGKHAVDEDEKKGAVMVGVLAMLGLTLGIASAVLQDWGLGLPALVFAGLLLPVGAAVQAEPGSKSRRNAFAYASIMAVIGFAAALMPSMSSLLGVYALGIIAFTWLGGAIMKG